MKKNHQGILKEKITKFPLIIEGNKLPFNLAGFKSVKKEVWSIDGVEFPTIDINTKFDPKQEDSGSESDNEDPVLKE